MSARNISRSRVARLLVVVVLAMSLVASADPASAGGVSSGSSGARSTTTPGGGGGGGGGFVVCDLPGGMFEGFRLGRAGHRGGVIIYDEYYGWDHTSASGSPRACGEHQESRAEYKTCDIAYEVWRFYGTEAKPAQAWTTSRAFIPNPCVGKKDMLFMAPHPHDAAVHFYASGNAAATAAHVANDPWDTQTSDVRGLIYDAVRATGDNRFTTMAPFRASAKPCYELQPAYGSGKNWKATQLDSFFKPGTADYNSDEGKMVRDYVLGTYDRLLGQGWKAGVARSFVNFPYGKNPKSSPGSYNDGLACSSDLDFWKKDAATGIATDKSKVVYSVCYIAVARQTLSFNYPSNNHRLDSFWTTRVEWPEYYYPPQTKQPNIPWESALKATIRSEIAGRPAPAQRHGQQHPSLTPIAPPGSSESAADYASKNVECSYGTGGIAYKAKPPMPTLPEIAYDVSVEGEEVGQVGGAIRRYRIDVTSNGKEVPCRTAPCVTGNPSPGNTGTKVTFVRDDSDLTLAAPAGYKECTTAGQLDCDYRIVTSYKDSKDAAGNGHMVVEFYRATPPNKPFKLTGKDGIRYKTDIYWQDCVISEGHDVVAGGGSGSSNNSSCSNQYQSMERVEPVTLRISPSPELHVIGAAIVPG